MSSDDSVVREKAITALKKISQKLSTQDTNGAYLDLVRRLKKGDIFSMRIAASQLYADIYNRIEESKKASVQKKFGKLVKDDTPMVRWGAAQAMSTLCHNLEKSEL